MRIWLKYLIGIAIGLISALVFSPSTVQGQAALDFIVEIAVRFGRYALLPVLFFSVSISFFKLRDEKLLTKADELVHIVFSSGLSGSFNSARIAVETLKEKLPNKKIYIVDSLCASSGYGLFMDMLADKRDEGVSAKELYEYAENLKLSIRHDFYSTDLTFYVRGGRVSKTAGFFGNILKICPVLDMNNEGKLIVRKKAHGRVKAREEMLASMLANAKDGRNYEGKCFISHSNCLDEAQKLVALLEKNFENLQGQIKIFSIGPTIGSHTGPGTVALFYVGAERGE